MTYRLRFTMALLASCSTTAVADGPNGSYFYDHSMMWGLGMFGGFGMLLFWGVIIFLLISVIRGGFWNSSNDTKQARQILDERFARGEIDEEEYAKRKRILNER